MLILGVVIHSEGREVFLRCVTGDTGEAREPNQAQQRRVSLVLEPLRPRMPHAEMTLALLRYIRVLESFGFSTLDSEVAFSRWPSLTGIERNHACGPSAHRAGEQRLSVAKAVSVVTQRLCAFRLNSAAGQSAS